MAYLQSASFARTQKAGHGQAAFSANWGRRANAPFEFVATEQYAPTDTSRAILASAFQSKTVLAFDGRRDDDRDD
jgi:hypothetical protein